ncbi:MAG: alpha-L-fucosidase [Anaerolineae bacterium]|nr:alpha-L-fucosidase [Anaerolineae bacterium]
MDKQTYLQQTAATRAERMRWWHQARFGMFIHWGLYAQLGRHEWVMNRERIPVTEYEKLADSWKPQPGAARAWAKLAKQAGMKYMVMTTKHHEGFCLWDTAQTDYNAMKHGPGRDLVAEYVDACHEFGLKVGFYYSLMDWHHPDGARCATDEAARRRFLDFTQGCVRELCSNYGKLDILWYDVSWPLESPERWESVKMNQMVRELQPDIIINNRSKLDEDFGTPEEHVTAEAEGRAWEACMTFNGSWGYMPSAIDWRSVREVIGLLNRATAGGGNLLLNIGPAPDGSVPPEAIERLQSVGQWVDAHGEAMYGDVNRADGRMEWMPTGGWSLKGNTAYYWCNRWPGSELAIGGLQMPVREITLLTTGDEIAFEQSADRLVMHGLPQTSPDLVAGVAVFKMVCEEPPRQVLGAGCVVL